MVENRVSRILSYFQLDPTKDEVWYQNNTRIHPASIQSLTVGFTGLFQNREIRKNNS